MIYLWLAITAICSYLIGNVNFARIIADKSQKEDITKKGSFNPGTMNMLRVYGFKTAFFTMIFEFIKGGIPAFIAGFTIGHFYPGIYHIAFFTAGLFAVLGQMYPVIYKFKGGKGLAVCAGIFTFSPLWWLGLILFAINFTILYYTDIASMCTLMFIGEMAIALSLYFGVFHYVDPYSWITIIIIWVMVFFVFLSHKQNLVRLFQGKENKANFAEKFDKMIKRKPKNKVQAEKEIVIDEKGKSVEVDKTSLTINEPENEIIIDDK